MNDIVSVHFYEHLSLLFICRKLETVVCKSSIEQLFSKRTQKEIYHLSPFYRIFTKKNFLWQDWTVYISSFVHLSGHVLLPRYLMNVLNSFDKTIREYLIARTDDLVRSWRSKVKVTLRFKYVSK